MVDVDANGEAENENEPEVWWLGSLSYSYDIIDVTNHLQSLTG